ncbi:hypothetical protein [Candidatus Albibeggiatoa sp. nov. BB20]|uniref:hypothetical protein n=1 Tax=Candidatus Albibeggiatoa sp. nov. BB20 TaxID=3162723 RepID=UPI0033653EE5
MNPKDNRIFEIVFEEIILIGILLLALGATIEGIGFSIIRGIIILLINLKVNK